MIVNSVLFCCCREKLCYRVHGIIYNGIFLMMAIAMVIMIAINYSHLNEKFGSLRDWSDYKDCVDEYMQINDY